MHTDLEAEDRFLWTAKGAALADSFEHQDWVHNDYLEAVLRAAHYMAKDLVGLAVSEEVG